MTMDELKNKPLFQATLGDLALLLSMSNREAVFEDTDKVSKVPPGNKLFGVKAIAQELGLSESTVKRHLKEGLYGKAVWKVGKSWVADAVKLWAIFKCNQTLKYSREYSAA